MKHYKAGLPLDYYPLYRASGWSAERIADFENAMSEHEGRTADLDTAARELKLTSSDPVVARLKAEENERFAAALREVLGEENLRRFNEFQAGATLRGVVGQMVGALIATPTPLEPAQVRQLEDAFRTHGFGRDGGERAVKALAYARRNFQLQSGDPAGWAAVLTDAKNFLTPPQMAELENQAAPTLRDDRPMSELRRLIAAAKSSEQPKEQNLRPLP